MENRVSYILVGLFVFILSLSMVGFVLWLGKYAQNENYNYYKVITAQSVSGLNPKAPVKLRGVSVGEVKEIYISKENSEEVIILIRVQEDAPIKEGAYALINFQGITGLSYIDLEGGTHESAPLKTDDKNYGIIRTKASIIERLDASLTTISKKTDKMLDKTDVVLSEKNLKNFEETLVNSAKSAKSMHKMLEMVHAKEKLIDDMFNKGKEFEIAATQAAHEIKKASKNIDTGSHEAFVSVQEASDMTSKVMQEFEDKLKDGRFDMDMILRENLLPFQNDLNDLRALIIETRDFMSELRDSPSNLLFKKSDLELAPSEEREK